MQKYRLNGKLAAIGSLVMAAALAACGGSEKGGGSKCSGLHEGDFIITEFMANPAGTDDFKEYVEIYNPGSEPLVLDGVQLLVAKSDGSSSKSSWRIKGSDVVINPGEYFVVGDFDDTQVDEATGVAPEPYQHLSYYFNKKLGLNNSNGMIGFKCGSTVVDSITYESSSEARAQILSGDKLNNPKDPTSWCAIPKEETYDIKEITSYTYNDDGSIKSTKPNYGTPGKANPAVTCDYTPPPACEAGPGQCCDDETGEARDIVPPEPGKLIITEIMAYAGDNVTQEDGSTKFVANKNYHYVELYAKTDFDLQGVKLSKSDKAKWALPGSDCMRVSAGQDFIVVKNNNSAENGGLSGDKLLLSSMDLNQSGTLSILVTKGTGESAQDVVIDSVEYPKTTANTSWQRSNDYSNNFCESTATYGNGFHGTPSAENTKCPEVGPKCETLAAGQCCDKGTPRNIKTPAVDDFVITEIMAYAGDDVEQEDGSTKFTANKNYQFIEILSDEAFDLNGLTVSKNATTGNWKIETDECVSVPANSYFVIAKNGEKSANGGIDADFVLSKLDMNQSGTIQFIADKGGANQTVIAEATYSKTTVNTSWQLSGDDSGKYCESSETYGEKFYGTPGEENSECAGATCLDNGTARKVNPAGVGDLVITEMMTNPVGANATEKTPAKWFEIKANKAVDMNGVVMKTDKTETIQDEKCLSVQAGGYFVVAFSDDSSVNGGLPANVIGYVQSKLALTYSGTGDGTLTLSDAEGTELSSATYPKKWTQAGYSIQFEGSSYCAAAANSEYGTAGNHGTPGAANTVCPVGQ